MIRLDQLVTAYYSPAVENQKGEAWRSLRTSIITGIGATGLFAALAFLIPFSILFQFNPLENIATLLLIFLGIPLLLVLALISIIFGFRYLLAFKKAKDLVDLQMRGTSQSDQQGTVGNEGDHGAD